MLCLKERAPIQNQDDMMIAKTNIELDITSQEMPYTIAEKYKLNIVRKNYFAKTNRPNQKEIEIIFHLKFSVEQEENSNLNSEELINLEENIDNNNNSNQLNQEEINEDYVNTTENDDEQNINRDNQEIYLDNENESNNYDEEY